MARYSQFLSLTFACAASTYFRCTTKVGKGVPKKGKTTVRSGFLPFLWNLSHLSTDRASPPRINARGLTDMITQRGSRDVGIFELKRQRRGEYVEKPKTQAPLARSAAMPPGAARTWLCHRRLAGRALPGRDYIRGHCPPSREPVFAFDAVRFLAADVRLHICEKTVPRTFLRALPGRHGGKP